MFKYLIFLTSLVLAGIAAYFSTFGVAAFLSAIRLEALIMAGSLEFGKLIILSSLYRNKDINPWWIQIFLFLLMIALIFVTFIGVYAFLGTGLENSMTNRDFDTQKVAKLKEERTFVQDKQSKLDADIQRISPDLVTARQKLYDKYAPEREANNKKIDALAVEISAIETSLMQQDTHLGPILAISKKIGQSERDTASYAILIFVLILDPAAIFLMFQFNIMDMRDKKLKAEAKALKQRSAVFPENVSFKQDPLPVVPPVFQPNVAAEHPEVGPIGDVGAPTGDIGPVGEVFQMKIPPAVGDFEVTEGMVHPVPEDYRVDKGEPELVPSVKPSNSLTWETH